MLYLHFACSPRSRWKESKLYVWGASFRNRVLSGVVRSAWGARAVGGVDPSTPEVSGDSRARTPRPGGDRAARPFAFALGFFLDFAGCVQGRTRDPTESSGGEVTYAFHVGQSSTGRVSQAKCS